MNHHNIHPSETTKSTTDALITDISYSDVVLGHRGKHYPGNDLFIEQLWPKLHKCHKAEKKSIMIDFVQSWSGAIYQRDSLSQTLHKVDYFAPRVLPQIRVMLDSYQKYQRRGRKRKSPGNFGTASNANKERNTQQQTTTKQPTSSAVAERRADI